MSKRNDPARSAAIADDYRAGMFYKAIIQKHHVSSEKLKAILIERGLYNSRRPDYSAAPKEDIARDYSAGVPLAIIQRKYGVSRDAIYDIARELGVVSGFRLTDEQERGVCSDYRGGVPSQGICAKYDINPVVFYRVLAAGGITCDRREKLKRLDHKAVIAEYASGDTLHVIGARHGVSRATIKRLLILHQVELRSRSEVQRIYAVNESYFDNINQPDRAYYLGFLWADGCNKPYDNTVQLIVNRRDEDVIQAFKASLQSEGRVRYYLQKTPKGKIEEYCDFAVYSKRFSERLVELGMVQAKTYAAELGLPLGLRPDMLRHFVRGLMDGDGWIFVSTKGSLNIDCGVTAHPTILAIIQEALRGAGVSSTITDVKLVNPDRCHTKRLSVGGNRNAIRFLQWLYTGNQGLRLARKYAIYQQAVKRYFNETKHTDGMAAMNFTHA